MAKRSYQMNCVIRGQTLFLKIAFQMKSHCTLVAFGKSICHLSVKSLLQKPLTNSIWDKNEACARFLIGFEWQWQVPTFGKNSFYEVTIGSRFFLLLFSKLKLSCFGRYQGFIVWHVFVPIGICRLTWLFKTNLLIDISQSTTSF